MSRRKRSPQFGLMPVPSSTPPHTLTGDLSKVLGEIAKEGAKASVEAQALASTASRSRKGGGGGGTKIKNTNVPQKLAHLTKVPNSYLAELVLPEQYGPSSYPDQFNAKSTTWRSIINIPLAYTSAAVGTTPSGAFLVAIKPSLVDPVLQMESLNAAVTMRGYVQTQSTNFGLFGVAARTLIPSQTQNSMLLSTDWANVVLPITYGGLTTAAPMFHGIQGTQDFYGIPSDATSYSVTVDFLKQLTAGWTVECRTVTEAGVGASTALTIEGATAVYAGAVPGTATPGWPGVGFQLRLAGTAPAGSMFSVTAVGITATLTTCMRWVGYQIPDVDQALDLFDQYRVVAQSALSTYRGSLMDNGGQIASTLFRGGESPSSNDLYKYDQIAQAPNAHDGPLVDGSYSFWLPADTVDMSFREAEEIDPWLHPYIVTGGIVATPAQTNALRLRVVINFEGISKSQLLHYEESRVNPSEIAHAAQQLKGQATSMTNNKHLKDLGAFLRKFLLMVPDAINWLDRNKGWIMPAAAAVGAALI